MSRLEEMLDKLEGAAKAATPGHWQCHGGLYIEVRDGRDIANMENNPGTSDEKRADGAHIAAANPQTILLLCQAVRVMREALENCTGGDLASGEGIYKAEVAREAIATVDKLFLNSSSDNLFKETSE